MRRSYAMLAMAANLSVLPITDVCAQSVERPKETRDTLDLVVTVVSEAVLALTIDCTPGDKTPWFFVISTIDRRYASCVKQDPRWNALAVGFEQEREEAYARKMVSVGVGTFAYIRAMNEVPATARATGHEAFCAPWKFFLNPAGDSAEQRRQLARVRPNMNIDKVLAVVEAVRNLGTKRDWADAACDESFWPTGFAIRERR